MKRRRFIQGTALSAIAVTTTGFIRMEGKSYVGNCQTTTDILGPFYRPNAPVRSDLVIPGANGDVVILKGKITHDDCSTPLQEAKVELWHCSADQVYDNESEDYNYRGTTFSDGSGAYFFRTQMPVPYDAGGGNYRPAHFHLMISAPGYQNLVTQLYFTGDPYLDKDRSSRAPSAKTRILDLQKNDEGLLVPFDIVMQKELALDPIAMEKLTGQYIEDENPGNQVELFEYENQLWLRNEVFGENFHYIGEKTFELSNTGEGRSFQVQFDLLADGTVKAKLERRNNNEVNTTIFTKKG